MSAPNFKTERTIINALLDALADQAGEGEPLLCERLRDGIHQSCDDVGDAENNIQKLCLPCRVFTSLRIARETLARIARKDGGAWPDYGCPECKARIRPSVDPGEHPPSHIHHDSSGKQRPVRMEPIIGEVQP